MAAARAETATTANFSAASEMVEANGCDMHI